jgi:hypothetical protein
LRAKHRVPPYVDLSALVELLSAALTLFALRAASGAGALGVGARSGSAEKGRDALDPGTPEGWRRIEKTVGVVARALLES